ncbi:hypothetical protein V8B97DRAFT_1866638 [Scleroderma yunnanense]
MSSPSSLTDPTTPPFTDNLEWITAYLTIHSLSVPSRRYSFLLWIVIVFFFLGFAIFHWSGARGGVLGARWSQWALPRRTWRNRARRGALQGIPLGRKTISLPSNAQLLSLSGMVLVSFALALAGPDYIAPGFKVWQFTVRNILQVTSIQSQELYTASTFDPYLPQYTISKSLWSSSARFGQIAFALFPLCVLFALKAPPFALFAIPYMVQFFFDKLVWLHRWSGRLIWLLTSIHVVLWSIQLVCDHNPNTGRSAYIHAFTYPPFLYGWIAFVLLTLIIIFSLQPIRRHFYEGFYFVHILLVPLTLITASLHHPPISFWCWAALVVWIGERLWRLTWWTYSNGFVYKVSSRAVAPVLLDTTPFTANSWEMNHLRHADHDPHASRPLLDTNSKRSSSPLSPYYDCNSIISPLSNASPRSSTRLSHFTTEPAYINPPPSPYSPPLGYVHAELLPGHAVRLRLITPRFLPWAPGQHFLLYIPSISRFTSHPFTCASVCDEQAQSREGRLMVFLVRARKGWTKDLWDTVARMIANQSRGDTSSLNPTSLPTRGVILRAFVDGPFGSSIRARWGDHSTAVIITGGSGVSFGLSVLQYLCLCLSGRDGRHLGGRPGGWGQKTFSLQRVRFIWLVREYSHVQWCASILRRCMSMVSLSSLKVDIYVTNFKPIPANLPALPSPSLSPSRVHFAITPTVHDELAPPHPNFARSGTAHLRSNSSDSVDSHDSYESDVDFGYYWGEHSDDLVAEDLNLAHETNILGLTNFHDEEDIILPAEKNLSLKVKTEGKLRRLQARRDDKTTSPRRDSESGLATTLLRSQPDASRAIRRSILSTHSADRLIPVSPLSECRSITSETDSAVSPVQRFGDTSLWSRPLSGLSTLADHPTVSLVTPAALPTAKGRVSQGLNIHCGGKSEAGGSRHTLPQIMTHGLLDSPGFEIDEQEANDVDVVSEHVRPGKPKLQKMITDEIERSAGSVVVACCGPSSLDAMVRKILSEQINPDRIRKGDMRGSITLISEEFEY